MGVSNSKGTVEALDNGAKSDTFNLADAEKLVNPPDLPDESEEEALIVQQEKQDNVESIPVKAGTENSSDEEKESFAGWLSATTSERSNSADTHKSAATVAQTHQTDSSNASVLIGQRPSADSPLLHHRHSSSGAAGGPHRKSSAQYLVSGDAPPATIPPAASSSEPRSSSLQSSRPSNVSSGTTGSLAFSPAASVRSSFALERASADVNRQSLETFQEAWRRASTSSGGNAPSSQAALAVESADTHVSLDRVMAMVGIPPAYKDRFAALSVIPLQTPVPCTMLALLWHTSVDDALTTAGIFAGRGVMNMAQLPNGQIWGLPQAQQLQLVQAACKERAEKFNTVLLNGYTRNGDVPLSQVADDGYYVANVMHHLIGAKRNEQAKGLLMDPAWLERKLKTAGAGGVVADVRRYLMIRSDKDVKLLLEAFQMSVGQALEHSNIPGLLRCQLASRLMTAPLSFEMQNWLERQQAEINRDASKLAAAGVPRCLPPLTPSLDQAGGLQRLALRGHRAAVGKVLLTPSGTDAVTASNDGTLRVYDLEIGDNTLVLDGHSGPVTDMAITNDGSLLVSTSEDATARAYEMERGMCLRVLTGHEGPLTCLVLDPWGRFAVTGSRDGTARVWDLGTARALHVLSSATTKDGESEVVCLALSPCTRFLIFGTADGTALMFDVISGQLMGILEGHKSWISAVKFTADGNHALTASHDGILRLWSLKTGRCQKMFTGHTGSINAMAVAGRLVATASEDGTARVWDMKTGSCRRVLKGHNGWVSSVAFFPNKEQLITTSGDATAIAWSVDSGEVVRVLEGHSGAVLTAVVTRKGRFAVTGSEDGTVRVWDFAASSSHTPKWHEGRIRALAARDGVLVATAGDDSVARLWDATLGEFRGLLEGHISPIRWAAFSLDGLQLATASPDRNIRVWDCETATCVYELPAKPGSRVKSFAVNGDLTLGALCLFDGSVNVWNLETGEIHAMLQSRGERDESKGHISAVNELLMSADGSTVVTLSKDATARVWSVEQEKCVQVLRGHTDAINGGSFAEQGQLLVTHSFDNTIKVWSLETGVCLRSFEMPHKVVGLAMTSCGKHLAVAVQGGDVLLASVEASPNGWAVLRGHSRDASGLSFSADGSQLASCSEDGTLRVWSSDKGVLTGLFVADCGLTCCHFDRVTHTVVAGTDRGVVHFVKCS